MPDAPDIVLCSKLCRHNPADPRQDEMHLSMLSWWVCGRGWAGQGRGWGFDIFEFILTNTPPALGIIFCIKSTGNSPPPPRQGSALKCALVGQKNVGSGTQQDHHESCEIVLKI